MPSFNDIQKRIKQNAFDQARRQYLQELSVLTGRDTIIYAMNDTQMIDVPDVQCFMAALCELKGKELDLIIHSGGGRSEATEQIVSYIRSKYKHVRAIIPLRAMSAATMLACACDEIVMGKQSAIGPIDPQLRTLEGVNVAAHAILEDFERAVADVKANPATAALWVPKLQRIPHGWLSLCKQTIARSRDLVAEWLETHAGHKKADAQRIAGWLAKYDHQSHGKPINAELARKNGLKIVDLESDQKMQDLVLSLFHATALTFMGTQCVKFAENQHGKGLFVQMQPQQQIQMVPQFPGAPQQPRPNGQTPPTTPGQPAALVHTKPGKPQVATIKTQKKKR